MYSEGQMELPDEDEENLCKVWDMAMDKVKYCHLVSIEFRGLLKFLVFREHTVC